MICAGLHEGLACQVSGKGHSVLRGVLSEFYPRRRGQDTRLADRRFTNRQLQHRQRHHRVQLATLAANDRPTR